ncbi:MAG: di-trans,poly-cis-decaprenylcistransferase [Acidobacteria bacterium]|nr:MAG: di-trans,poly-cis-decaprenylcistransferase [Acidobacteriota bacterium]
MARNRPSAERDAALREIKRLGLNPERIPRHVAIVMDGNGRWAQARGLPRTEGHAAGESALFDTVEGALEIGLDCLTVFAFSTENWRRPASEVRYLMKFNESLLVRRRDELNERGVRMLFSGRRDWRVPKRLLRHMDESIELTKKNTRMDFVIAFNYGGRAEIVDAVRKIASDVADGATSPEKIDEKSIARHLYHPEVPEPDLVIRTSGEIRTSNFLLWEAAYAEYVFTPVLWPDFNREQLFAAIAEYQSRDRRFGGVEERK